MRSKKLLATFLLGVGLCFVPVLGCGEVEKWTDEKKTSYTEALLLLSARVDYIMYNPATFLNVDFYYDSEGT